MGICTVIAAHNAADTIARAVKSALAEPETAEVIVVDDASADGTAARARAADDSSGRLKILTQPANAGPSAARNRAIAESKAPWIAILDADDFFLPERFKRLLALESDADFIADDIGQVFEGAIDGSRKSLLGLEQLPIGKNRTSSSPLAGEVRRGGEKPGISVNDQQTGKASSSVTPPPLTPPARGGEFDRSHVLTAIEPQRISFAAFVSSNVSDPKRQRGELGFLKPIMRRDFLNAHNLRYRESMRLGEDYELYARALAMGARFYLLPAEGYVSVMRPNSLSGRHTEEDLLHLRDCDMALARLPGLTAADRDALHRHYLSVDCRLQWRLLINAVKQRNMRAAIHTFMRPWPVPFYLTWQLADQAALRVLQKLKRQQR